MFFSKAAWQVLTQSVFRFSVISRLLSATCAVTWSSYWLFLLHAQREAAWPWALGALICRHLCWEWCPAQPLPLHSALYQTLGLGCFPIISKLTMLRLLTSLLLVALGKSQPQPGVPVPQLLRVQTDPIPHSTGEVSVCAGHDCGVTAGVGLEERWMEQARGELGAPQGCMGLLWSEPILRMRDLVCCA